MLLQFNKQTNRMVCDIRKSNLLVRRPAKAGNCWSGDPTMAVCWSGDQQRLGLIIWIKESPDWRYNQSGPYDIIPVSDYF